MKTKQAESQDFDTLYALWEEAGLQLYPRENELTRFQSMLKLNKDLCLLLLDDHEIIVGSILGAFDGRTASIHRLAIKPELQKKGLGTLLLKELEKVLLNKGVKKLSAQVHITNTFVVPFYQKQGFSEMSYVKTFFKDI